MSDNRSKIHFGLAGKNCVAAIRFVKKSTVTPANIACRFGDGASTKNFTPQKEKLGRWDRISRTAILCGDHPARWAKPEVDFYLGAIFAEKLDVRRWYCADAGENLKGGGWVPRALTIGIAAAINDDVSNWLDFATYLDEMLVVELSQKSRVCGRSLERASVLVD